MEKPDCVVGKLDCVVVDVTAPGGEVPKATPPIEPIAGNNGRAPVVGKAKKGEPVIFGLVVPVCDIFLFV